MTQERVLVATIGGRRGGKSLRFAVLAAAYLKAGKPVSLLERGPDGKVIAVPIVGVPGFDDGRQITDQRRGE